MTNVIETNILSRMAGYFDQTFLKKGTENKIHSITR